MPKYRYLFSEKHIAVTQQTNEMSKGPTPLLLVGDGLIEYINNLLDTLSPKM
jgi:hypothetical protein